MTEDVLREIIGLAPKSKWNKVKQFIIEIVKSTLRKNIGYTLVALDARFKDNEQSELSLSINTPQELNTINQIQSFSNLSLYQYSQNSSNHINLSQNNGTIVLIAKFMGPEINHDNYFDFAIYIDPIEEPHFTTGTGETLSCSELLKLFKNKEKLKANSIKPIKTKSERAPYKPKKTRKNQIRLKKSDTKSPSQKRLKKSKPRMKKSKVVNAKGQKITRNTSLKSIKSVETKPDDMEAIIYEKLTNKKTRRRDVETKTYQVWKNKSTKNYRKETGKNPYYKGNATQGYIAYLQKVTKPQKKKPAPKKNASQKKSPVKKKKKSP